VFKTLTRFVLQEPRRINVLSIAAAILMAESIVRFVYTIGNALATPLIFAIYAKASRDTLQTREFSLGSAVYTVIGALASLALAAIALYLIARWSERRPQLEATDQSQ
jgi:large-conductance mechanosensitive channel